MYRNKKNVFNFLTSITVPVFNDESHPLLGLLVYHSGFLLITVINYDS